METRELVLHFNLPLLFHITPYLSEKYSFMNQEVILQKARVTSTITSMLEIHRNELAPTLAKRLFGDDSRDSLRSAEQMLDAHCALLESSLGQISTAHDNLIEEAADDEPYRARRHELIEALIATLQTTSNLIEAAYGEDALAHFHLIDELPRSGEHLQQRTAQIVRTMRENPITEPSPHGFDLDFAPIAQKIEKQLAPLHEVLEDIRREAREIREAIDTFKSSVEEFDATYVAVSEAIHAFCLLARRPDLASILQYDTTEPD